MRRIEEISHTYVLDLTFTDVMSSNTTVYSRRNTTLTVGKKMNIQYEIMQSILCNLNNMNTNNMCMNKPFIALISVNVQD